MTTVDVWGPEIPVNGVRPDWLTTGTYRIGNGIVDFTAQDADSRQWSHVSSIRLPVGHPYYADILAPEREDRSDTATLPPALVERMVALVRVIAKDREEPYVLEAVENEARAIAVELPEADTTGAIARRLVADEWPDADPRNEHALVRAAWLGLKHRQLEREGQ